jgi:hypothetical protein
MLAQVGHAVKILCDRTEWRAIASDDRDDDHSEDRRGQ